MTVTDQLIIFVIIILVISFFIYLYLKDNKNPNSISPEELQNKLDKLPDILLHKIIGKTNVIKGSFGELISFLKIKSEYDKVLPFHDIVDFIAIRYPTENNPGTIDFIDIKTGQARLTKEQKAIKELIENKNISFKKIKLTVNEMIK